MRRCRLHDHTRPRRLTFHVRGVAARNKHAVEFVYYGDLKRVLDIFDRVCKPHRATQRNVCSYDYSTSCKRRTVGGTDSHTLPTDKNFRPTQKGRCKSGGAAKPCANPFAA